MEVFQLYYWPHSCNPFNTLGYRPPLVNWCPVVLGSRPSVHDLRGGRTSVTSSFNVHRNNNDLCDPPDCDACWSSTNTTRAIEFIWGLENALQPGMGMVCVGDRSRSAYSDFSPVEPQSVTELVVSSSKSGHRISRHDNDVPDALRLPSTKGGSIAYQGFKAHAKFKHGVELFKFFVATARPRHGFRANDNRYFWWRNFAQGGVVMTTYTFLYTSGFHPTNMF